MEIICECGCQLIKMVAFRGSQNASIKFPHVKYRHTLNRRPMVGIPFMYRSETSQMASLRQTLGGVFRIPVDTGMQYT